MVLRKNGLAVNFPMCFSACGHSCCEGFGDHTFVRLILTVIFDSQNHTQHDSQYRIINDSSIFFCCAAADQNSPDCRVSLSMCARSFFLLPRKPAANMAANSTGERAHLGSLSSPPSPSLIVTATVPLNAGMHSPPKTKQNVQLMQHSVHTDA